MTRSKIAAFLALAFIVLFCFAGVTATTTVKDTTVAIQMGMPKLLFSLSSAPLLLIPLALVAAVAAFIAFIQEEKNVGMLFSFVATVAFGLFMVFFAMEEKNSALYTPIAEALDLAEVKFKKRDVKLITPGFDILTWLTLVSIGLACVIGHGDFSKDKRHLMKRDLLPYAYIAPHLFFFIIFFMTPEIYGVYAAFT